MDIVELRGTVSTARQALNRINSQARKRGTEIENKINGLVLIEKGAVKVEVIAAKNLQITTSYINGISTYKTEMKLGDEDAIILGRILLELYPEIAEKGE